jgi:hypothetical protein
MQDGLTQHSHPLHASKSDADRKGISFGALEAPKRVRARVLRLEVLGPKTISLCRLRRRDPRLRDPEGTG